MRTCLGIQARSNSTRLPGKIYKDLLGKSVLEHVVEKCLPLVREGAELRILIPYNDVRLIAYCDDHSWPIIKGDPFDLLDRYSRVFREGFDSLIRLTSDCPTIPTEVIQEVISNLSNFDYVSNVCYRTVPDGWDCQGILDDAFEWVDQHQAYDREHPFLWLDLDATFRSQFYSAGYTMMPLVRQAVEIRNPYVVENKLSIDTEEDLERVRTYMEQERTRIH